MEQAVKTKAKDCTGQKRNKSSGLYNPSEHGAVLSVAGTQLSSAFQRSCGVDYCHLDSTGQEERLCLRPLCQFSEQLGGWASGPGGEGLM